MNSMTPIREGGRGARRGPGTMSIALNITVGRHSQTPPDRRSRQLMRCEQAAHVSVACAYGSWIRGLATVSSISTCHSRWLTFSDLCSLSSRYSPDSQARTCCLSPLKMASVILLGNPAGCPVVICA